VFNASTDDGLNAKGLSGGEDSVDGVREENVPNPLPVTPAVTGQSADKRRTPLAGPQEGRTLLPPGALLCRDGLDEGVAAALSRKGHCGLGDGGVEKLQHFGPPQRVQGRNAKETVLVPTP
jgi:hypothetical protein